MIEQHDSFRNLTPKPDFDFYAVFENGITRPYNTLAEVMTRVDPAFRSVGKMFLVNLGDSNGQTVYWFKGGTQLANLVPMTTIVTEPPVDPPVDPPTGTGWRHATLADIGVIPNVTSVGDFIIDGPSDTSGNIRTRPGYSNYFTMDVSDGPKKIIIKGGQYNRIELWVKINGGSPRDITITNYDGQVRCIDMSLGGLQGIKITGKYDPVKGTGDTNFRGHDVGTSYAFTQDKYGFRIKNGWGANIGKFLFELTSVVDTNGVRTLFDNTEVEYLEAGDGGFTNMVKYDLVAGQVGGLIFRHCYFHDIHSEGAYVGSTSPSEPQIGFVGVLFEDCRVLRMGSDGIQINQILGDTKIRKCVVHAAINWRSTFQANQDFGMSIGCRNGGFLAEQNVFLGGSAFFQLFTKKVVDSSFVSSGVIEVHNNAFSNNVGPNCGYVGFNSHIPNISFKITNNDFFERTFLYNQVYLTGPASVNEQYLIRYANNAPLTLTGNRWDASQQKTAPLIVSSGYTPVTTVSDNEAATIPTLKFVNYMGFPDGFNYTNFSDWTGLIGGTYGDEGPFPGPPATAKGTAMSYVANQHYVTRFSKFYKCIVSHNTVQDPALPGSNVYWEQIFFTAADGTVYPYPADDVRLKGDDYHNSLGRGLTLNLPVSGASCGVPTTAQITGITNNKATATWAQPVNVTNYSYELHIGSTFTDNIFEQGTTIPNLLSFNGLTPSTAYRLRVRTNCTNGSQSIWTDFGTFTTQANPVVAADTVNIAVRDEGNQFSVKYGTGLNEYNTSPRFNLIGSSTASGVGPTTTAETVAARLQTELNIVNGLLYVNAISGLSSDNGMPTNDADPNVRPQLNITNAISSKPTGIIVMYPSNDIQDGATPSQFANRLITIHREGLKYGIPTFIVGTQPRDSYTAAQQQLLLDTDVLLAQDIPDKYLILPMQSLRDTTNLSKPAQINPAYAAGDSIHLNGNGHAILFDMIITKIKAFYQNTTIYDQYIIERGTTSAVNTPPVSWSTVDTITGSDLNLGSKLYARQNNSNIYGFRVRARKISDGTYVTSNIDYLQQPFLREVVEKSIKIDPSIDTNAPDSSGEWNLFNATSSGPALNASIALLDSGGNPTGMTATVTKTFLNANTGGASSGIYPIRIMQDGWAVTRSATDRSQIVISGANPNAAYRVTILSSKGGNLTNRGIGVFVNGKFNGSPSTLPASTTANQYEVGVIEGVIANGSNNFVIDVYSRGDVGFINAIVIDQYATTNLTCSVASNLTNTGLTYKAVVNGWTGHGDAATYEYELYVGTVASGTLFDSDTVTSTSVSRNDLNSETQYQFRVRVICANTVVSSWVTSATFTTLQEPSGPSNKISINPHFDANGLTTNPNWNNWLTSSTSPQGLSSIYFEDGSLSGYTLAWGALTNSSQFDNGATYGATGATIAPQAVLRQSLSTTGGPGFSGGRAEIVISGLNNAYTYDFEFIGSRAATGYSSEYQVTGRDPVTNAVVSKTSSALVTDNNLTNSVTVIGVKADSGVARIKFAKSLSTGFGFLTGLKITVNTGVTPTCAIPTGAVVSSITGTTANLSWTNDPANVSTYDYEVATTVGGSPLKSGYGISGNSVNLTGLTAATTYYYRYRANCTNAVTSNWASGSFSTAGGGGGSTDDVYTVMTTPYNTATPNQFGYVYTPMGYNDGNSNLYPLQLFLHGSGETGSNPADLNVTGLPQLLNAGQVMKCVIVCGQLQGGSNSWPAATVKKIYDWSIVNYRIDTSRVYVTGLSLGASGTWMFLKAYPSLVTAYVCASGTAYPLDVSTEASTLALIKDIPGYFVHGDGDSGATNETNTQDVVTKLNQASPKGLYPPRVQIIYNTGHNNTTWNDYLYGKSKLDINFPLFYEDWCLMHSKTDALYTATEYVKTVENFITAAQVGSGGVNHYKFEYAHQFFAKAKSLVDALPADANKTALVSRYTTAKNTMDTVYGRRWIVNIGATGSLTNINTNSGATSAATTNLVDYNGGASTLSYTTNTQSGGARSTPGMDNAYWSMPVGVFSDGRDTFGNGGAFTIGGLTAGKTYKMLLVPSRNAVSAGNPANSPEMTATIGTTVKWMLGSYNMFEWMEFTVTGVTSQQILIKGGWTLNAGVTPTKEITGCLVTTTSNVANYTAKGGAGALTMVIIIEKP